MSDTFNGLHVWLGIPPNEQPPNHYRLLGITIFETDLDVIDHAADRQMAHIRTFQSGRHGALSQQILNELAAARLCLLSPDRKTVYDKQLRAKLNTGARVAPVQVGKALPVARPITESAPHSRAPAAPPPKVAPPPRVAPSVIAPQQVGPALVDEGPLDLESAASNSFDAPSVQIKVKRRRYKRDTAFQNAAIVGTLAGVVVIGCFVLYYVLRNLDWQQVLRGVSPPNPVQTAPPAGPVTEPPAAPAPTPQ